MLADKQIKQLIQQGKIRITPYDEDMVSPSAYYVHLGENILIPKPGQKIDLNHSANPKYIKKSILKSGLLLKPGDFVLAQTAEQVAMDRNIGILLDTRSTLARLGISIHQTSMFLRPGQNDHVITLEVYNAGNFEVRLWPGNKVGKLIFFQTSVDNGDYIGNYINQKEVMGANIIGDPVKNTNAKNIINHNKTSR